MAHIDATTANFQKEAVEASSNTLVLVDFWAPWCGPCRLLGPLLEEIAEEFPDKITVVKVNVDEEEALAMQYQISSIPAMKFMKDGKIVHEMVGVNDNTRQEIIKQIETA